tara:strand:+ start:953 stop:1933 length:981 start_codon:yes stop_codon:yes gene_type:complete
MSNYASAKLAVDVAKENRWKEKQSQDATQAREDEEKSKSIFGFIGKVVGGAIAGPVGYVVGEFIGREGADLAIDSESVLVDQGKFNKSSVDTYNNDLQQWDSDADWADTINTAKSSLFAFNAAGGITSEGLNFDVDFTKWMTADGTAKSSGEIVSDWFNKNKDIVTDTTADATNVVIDDANLSGAELDSETLPYSATTSIEDFDTGTFIQQTEQKMIDATGMSAEEISQGTGYSSVSQKINADGSVTFTTSRGLTAKEQLIEYNKKYAFKSSAYPGIMDYSEAYPDTFDDAFGAARLMNEDKFVWQGQLYSTQLETMTLNQSLGGQ